jgi:hypothetical protein
MDAAMNADTCTRPGQLEAPQTRTEGTTDTDGHGNDLHYFLGCADVDAGHTGTGAATAQTCPHANGSGPRWRLVAACARQFRTCGHPGGVLRSLLDEEALVFDADQRRQVSGEGDLDCPQS